MAKNDPVEEIYAAYLYYFDSFTGPARCYEYFNIRDYIRDPDKKMEELAKNAYNRGNNPPEYCFDERDFIMRRKSYIVFVVEDKDELPLKYPLKFHSKTHGNDGKHTFRYKKMKYLSIPVGSGANAKVLNIVYCPNDLTKWQGGDLGERDFEDFQIYLPFSSRKAKEPGTGGTNMGPPVPPPGKKTKRAARR